MPHKLLRPGKRGPYWYLRGTDAGGRFEVSTGKTARKDAEAWTDIWLVARARSRVPGAGQAVGFAAAAGFYKAANPHLSKADVRLVDRVATHLSANGDPDCRTVTQAHLVATANELLPGRAASTKNRKVIAPGAAVLHYAAEQKWCEHQRIKKFWESRKSSREPARDDDLARLIANAEAPPRKKTRGRKKDYNVAYKRVLLAMLYETGLRISHLLSVDWTRIDLPAGRVRVQITKSDELAAVPISEVVVSMLANLPVKTGRLFPWSTRRGVYGWLKPLTDRLKITYTPHMSRHKLATDADEKQIPDKRAAELGVWLDPRSLHRYQHVRPDAIPGRDAGKLLDVTKATRARSA
jgi:integrase